MATNDEVLNDEIFDIHAEFCRAISDPKRLKIIWLLDGKEMSVGQIAEAIGTHISNVSQHLRVLRAKHIVQSRKEGQVVYYTLRNAKLPKVCRELRSILLDDYKRRGRLADGIASKGKK